MGLFWDFSFLQRPAFQASGARGRFTCKLSLWAFQLQSCHVRHTQPAFFCDCFQTLKKSSAQVGFNSLLMLLPKPGGGREQVCGTCMCWDMVPPSPKHCCKLSKFLWKHLLLNERNLHTKFGLAVSRAFPLRTGHVWLKAVLACLPIPFKRWVIV